MIESTKINEFIPANRKGREKSYLHGLLLLRKLQDSENRLFDEKYHTLRLAII